MKEEKKLKKEQPATQEETKTEETTIGGIPRKTAYLLIGLVVITLLLLLLAVYNFNLFQSPSNRPAKSTMPSYAQALLNILPPQATVNPDGSKTYTATVRINTPATGFYPLNAAELDLSFDPKVLSNVDIKAGPLINNPVILLKKIDTQKGIINFDLATSPTEKRLGYLVGNLAVITFTINPAAKGTTAINFLPSTIITSSGYSQSILQGAYGASFNLNSQ